MASKRLVTNGARYLAVAVVCVALSALYYGFGALLIGLLMIPGMIASVLLAGVIPPILPTMVARLCAVAVSTAASYVAIAAGQTAIGLSDSPPEISPWSPTYAVTFIGLLAGFVFGLVAILGPQRRGDSGPTRPAC